jgi:hypothetical protein
VTYWADSLKRQRRSLLCVDLHSQGSQRLVDQALTRMGWHITGTCGVFDAAAACDKILGLDIMRCIDCFPQPAFDFSAENESVEKLRSSHVVFLQIEQRARRQ